MIDNYKKQKVKSFIIDHCFDCDQFFSPNQLLDSNLQDPILDKRLSNNEPHLSEYF